MPGAQWARVISKNQKGSLPSPSCSSRSASHPPGVHRPTSALAFRGAPSSLAHHHFGPFLSTTLSYSVSCGQSFPTG